MIAKVISGGQTGVDIAALRAAKSRGIPTGGMMPKGFRTLAGPRPDWAQEFGLTEHTSPSYPARTHQNVRDSDITIRIAVDFESAGELCTAKAIERYNRPWFDVYVLRTQRGLSTSQDLIFGAAWKIQEVRALIGRDVVVNFAGNSERTVRGIEVFAEGVVKMILDALEAS